MKNLKNSKKWLWIAASTLAVVPSVYADSLSDGGGTVSGVSDGPAAPLPQVQVPGTVILQGGIRRSDRGGPAAPSSVPPTIGFPQPQSQASRASPMSNAMVIYPWAGTDLYRRGLSGSVYGAVNFRNGLYLGTPGYGFGTSSTSPDYLIAFSSRFAVCNWNGYGYQPYSASLGSVGAGKPGYGYSQISDCAIATYDSQGGAVCNWNGSSYQPYNALTGKAIGKTDYGFSRTTSCNQATTNAIPGGVVCQWNGSNYQPYSIQTGLAAGRDGYGYSSLDSCSTATASVANGLVCNWAGSAYYQYDVVSNQQVRGPYNSVGDCIAHETR